MEAEEISLNKLALPLVEELIEKPERYGIMVEVARCGAHVLDLGVKAPGSLDAGLKMIEACLGGLGVASLTWVEVGGPGVAAAYRSGGQASMPTRMGSVGLPAVSVWTHEPALATLGAQMAGWKLELGGHVVLGSGPARALAKKPKKVFRALGHEERSDVAILAIEADELPDDDFLTQVAGKCGVKPENLYVLVASLRSTAGMVQVVGRAVEACILKLMNLGFDVRAVKVAMGFAVLPPPHPDPDVCMGRSNDALLYGSVVHLWTDFSDEEASEAARKAPSSTSPAYGKPFLTIYEEAGRDFYAIDPGIFAPAQVVVTSLRSGRSYKAGQLNDTLISRAFGLTG